MTVLPLTGMMIISKSEQVIGLWIKGQYLFGLMQEVSQALMISLVIPRYQPSLTEYNYIRMLKWNDEGVPGDAPESSYVDATGCARFVNGVREGLVALD